MTPAIPLSALEHFSYCPRQWGLIHLEQQYSENEHTMRGNAAHELVDTHSIKKEKGVRVERSMPLYSLVHNLIGRADVVEFHADGRVFPVEYKHGNKRAKRHDELQLLAQALCLEEMLGITVPAGAIYHVSSHQRREVLFTDMLREALHQVIAQIRHHEADGTLPPPVNDARCHHCSLAEICQPAIICAAQRMTWEAITEEEGSL